ncbi:MAG: hypothetical protein ACRC41_05270 [Sarcina sp.]
MSRELINDAYKIVRELTLAHSTCKSAISLGEWDFWIGGFFISLIKQKRIAKLREELVVVKRSIDIFNKKLKNSNYSIDANLDIDISNLLKIGDVFFDNMIFDLMVSSKLIKLNATIIEAKARFESLIRKL